MDVFRYVLVGVQRCDVCGAEPFRKRSIFFFTNSVRRMWEG